MRVRRNIASIPARSAKETWRAIIHLVTGSDSVDREQLEESTSIMESIIADEQPAKVPIVFKGSGPQVLIFCLFDENAMEAGLDVDVLNFNPTSDDWYATAPCELADVEWMNNTLKQRAPRITVHDANEKPQDDTEEKTAAGIEIDWDALDKL